MASSRGNSPDHRAPVLELLCVHLLAAGSGLGFAFAVFCSPQMTSAAQFVAPALVMMLVHLAWLAHRRRLVPGFARLLASRTVTTAFVIVVVTGLLAVLAPMPAGADVDPGAQVVMGIYMIAACLLIVAVVGVVVAGAGFLAVISIRATLRYFKGPKPPEGPPESRVQDFATAAAVLAALSVASLEGVLPSFRLDTAGRASATVIVAAPPDRVWAAVSRATSPEFPIPALLEWVPRPVAILVDEGADLGDRRIVRFRGREGEGDLMLQVARRTPDEAVFEVQSDTSPIATWVDHRAITFRVTPETGGTRLTVTLDYDRKLAPAWFFRPYLKTAAYLAVDVLARDTGRRAEAR